MKKLTIFAVLNVILIMLFSAFSLQLSAQSYSHYKNHHPQQHHKPIKPIGIQKKKAVEKTETKKEDPDLNQDEEISDESISIWGTPVSKDSLSKIKAVVISANVDGITGSHTKAFAEGMKNAVDFLKEKGVNVQEFICPNDDWDKIVDRSVGAHILIYSGHGVYDGKRPPSWVGGFSLTKSFVTSKDIQEKLKLAPQALVIFNHACFTAGSAAGDVGDIGLAEAHRRVAIYSHPFIDLGVGCYYANNWDGSTIDFLDDFFSRRKVKDIYKEEASEWSKILEEKSYDFNKQYVIGISSSEADYCAAYVGKPNFTVLDWFRK